MDQPKKVKFATDMPAVNCEKATRVTLTAGVAYDVLLMEPARKPGDVVLNLADPKEKHLGGDDGLTPHPCTLRLQVPAEQVLTA